MTFNLNPLNQEFSNDDLDIKDIRSLIQTLKNDYNYDFSNYAMSSFKRRIGRILTVYKFKDIQSLIDKIKEDRSFLEKMINEITVNTTEMFRDPSFWRKLRDEILPVLAKNKNIFIWHAACSSGEEVYSMCILLKEMGILERTTIWATDINEEVIRTAQLGIYPKHHEETNKNNYIRLGGKGNLSDYYKSTDNNSVHFDTSLLSNVKFRKHDLVQGAAFSKFDLILCRNVMIYFNFALQDKVMELFDQSIFSGGHLAIGSKETIAWSKSAKNYRTISIEEKIYKKIN